MRIIRSGSTGQITEHVIGIYSVKFTFLNSHVYVRKIRGTHVDIKIILFVSLCFVAMFHGTMLEGVLADVIPFAVT